MKNIIKKLMKEVKNNPKTAAGEVAMFGFTVGLGALAFGLLSGCWQSKK